MDELLDETARAALAELLPEWNMLEGRDALRRKFRFPDFSAAWAFVSRVALLAEAQGHHPEWSNIHNRVVITLTTHDAGGVSARDVRMAQAIDAF